MYVHIHKSRVPVFQIDKVLKSHGHTAPYHAELNAFELIRSTMKGLPGAEIFNLKRRRLKNSHTKVLKVLARRNGRPVVNM